MAKGWDYAQKYEELQAQFQRVNQLLKEDGSQIDDKQDFAALDQDAFQKCEPRVEAPIQATEVVSAHLEIAPVPLATAESAVNSIPPVILDEKDAQPEETPVVVAEQTHHHVTLDEMRRDLELKRAERQSNREEIFLQRDNSLSAHVESPMVGRPKFEAAHAPALSTSIVGRVQTQQAEGMLDRAVSSFQSAYVNSDHEWQFDSLREALIAEMSQHQVEARDREDWQHQR